MSKLRDVLLVSETDWARLAAFVDGEGCVSVKSNRHRSELIRLHITSTDPRLMRWLVGTFGGAVTTVPSKSARWRDRFDWYVMSHDAAVLLRMCLPYLLLKTEQARVALAYQATVRHRGHVSLDAATVKNRSDLKSKIRVLNAKGPRAVNE